MPWIKVCKVYYGNGPDPPDYLEYDIEENIESLVDFWEEETAWESGDYHSIEWEKVESPPKEWIKSELEDLIERSDNMYKNYRKNKISIEKAIKKYRAYLKLL